MSRVRINSGSTVNSISQVTNGFSKTLGSMLWLICVAILFNDLLLVIKRLGSEIKIPVPLLLLLVD